ncbi:MAG: UvrB/UvrC motif-containing protein, partial [Candidatus Gottesmanbacteria bacterium]|nr:UvrB/UvrC motif-containing protein [Candidatus Gottesmanbacteria bacterium]
AKIKLLVSQIAEIETITTTSEFDALLLEAKLIHDNAPKYNVVLKDDKSPLYILLTLSEVLPHVYTMRRSDLPKKFHKQDALFGPFQSATMVRSILRQLRHTIPYCTQKKRTGRPCFYSHIGLCNPCPSAAGTDKTLYRRNIFRLKNILCGKSDLVLKDLEKDMKMAANEQRFEDAAILRNHIQNLYFMMQKRYDPMLYMNADTGAEDIFHSELESLRNTLVPYIPELRHLHRIECIDISNTSGRQATGSLVILTDGHKDTNEYKRFRIRREIAQNDTAMIAEVVTRRFSHPEWPKPDLLVIDGGKGQVRAAQNAHVPVIGLAKHFEEIIVPHGPDWKIIRIPYTSAALHVLERVRDEAHRFAISYHRLLRKKAFVRE